MAPLATAAARVLIRAAQFQLRQVARSRMDLAFRRRAYVRILETAGRKARQLDQAVRETERLSAREALEVARELSSGRYSSDDLRRLGHPYRIGGTPPQDPAIINRQTGAFFRAWRVIGPRKEGGRLTTRVVNESDRAKRLERGTSRMIARPILERIRERVDDSRQALYRAAIRRVLR